MNLKFEKNDLLIDVHGINFKGEFYNQAEKDDFEKHKNITNPIYLGDKKIEIRHNNKGYRTKNIEDVDKDFVLIFGCSHTEGVGHFYEDIWCNVLFDRIGIDRINLGKGGSGPDIQYYNTLQYIKCGYPKPKMVIYQWPESTRKSFSYQKNGNIWLQHYHFFTKTSNRDWKWYSRRYISKDQGEQETNCYFWYTAANMLWMKLDVPVYNWTIGTDFVPSLLDLHVINCWDPKFDIPQRRARDRMHESPEQMREYAAILYPHVKKLL